MYQPAYTETELWIQQYGDAALEAVKRWILEGCPKLSDRVRPFQDTQFDAALGEILKKYVGTDELIEWASMLTDGDIPSYEQFLDAREEAFV